MVDKYNDTVSFSKQEFKEEYIKSLLNNVSDALVEKGYNPINQLTGYLISNDPAYISSHKGARNLIKTIERYEIIEELVRNYLSKK